jgi:hypothetical protein
VRDGFVLIGVEGDEVRWAPLATDGTLGTESKLTVPTRSLRAQPWFGVTGRNAPGDQLVVAYVAPKPGATNQLQIMTISQVSGGAPSAPTPLVDLPAGVDPNIIRLAMSSSSTGQRAVLTWGYEGQDASPSILLLRGDGQPIAPAAPLYEAGGAPRWKCLSVDASRTDFSISVLETPPDGRKPSWRSLELRDDGSRDLQVTIGLDVVPTTCPVSAPTPGGYVIAYQNDNGTFFSDFNVDKIVLNSEIVVGVLTFGGAAKQPKLACVAPMGAEYSLLFDRASGPFAWRFDAFGSLQGSPLHLPSTAGRVGPASAWPGQNFFHTTYLDQKPASAGGPTDGNSSGNSRYLVRVDCPAATPALPPSDAAPPDGPAGASSDAASQDGPADGVNTDAGK